jgi:1,4-dihydroxy-2-naphthoate polyprenyltransferase
LSNVKIWLQAFRLRTLPLALSSILMGAFLAYFNHSFSWTIFLLCITTTIFLQILSNLANDYGDSVHGADSLERKGPKRAVQSGVIASSTMKFAVMIFVGLSLCSGLILLFFSFGSDWQGILYFLALGLLSIAAAIAYTVGHKPYGYAGLGDVAVFIFFGIVGVAGSFYLFSKTLTWEILMPAASCGVFSIAVLNINNIRDIESDFNAGKYSVPVRIGRQNAIIYHWLLLTSGLVAAVIFTLVSYRSPWQFLFLAVTPLVLKNAIIVSKTPSYQLDPFLKQMALTTLLFVLLFGIGLTLSV